MVQQTRISPEDIDTVAGVDTGYRNDTAYAAVVVRNMTDIKILEEAVAAKPVQFPYVPAFIKSSISSTSRGMVSVKSTGPFLVMRISFSMRTPMDSSRI